MDVRVLGKKPVVEAAEIAPRLRSEARSAPLGTKG